MKACGGRRLCSRTQRPRIKLCVRRPREQRWAHVAQHFPPRVSRALAYVLLPNAKAGGCAGEVPPMGEPTGLDTWAVVFLCLPLGLSGHACVYSQLPALSL